MSTAVKLVIMQLVSIRDELPASFPLSLRCVSEARRADTYGGVGPVVSRMEAFRDGGDAHALVGHPNAGVLVQHQRERGGEVENLNVPGYDPQEQQDGTARASTAGEMRRYRDR